MRRRSWLVAAAAVAIFPSEAEAHARLGRSDPTDGAVLDVAPAAVRLFFDTVVEPTRPRFSLVDAAGKRVDLDATGFGAPAREVTVPLPPLEEGAWALRFSLLSADGHRVRGRVRFTVR